VIATSPPRSPLLFAVVFTLARGRLHARARPPSGAAVIQGTVEFSRENVVVRIRAAH
jgi:hypothetical protein